MDSLLYFLRVREQELQKFELSERDKEAAPLKTVIPATTVNEREDVQFDTVKRVVKKDVLSDRRCLKGAWVQWKSTNPSPFLLDLKLESEEAGKMA